MNRRFFLKALGLSAGAGAAPALFAGITAAPVALPFYTLQSGLYDFGHMRGVAIAYQLSDGTTIRRAARFPAPRSLDEEQTQFEQAERLLTFSMKSPSAPIRVESLL